jgi:CRP-like cAMP-binding protein
METESILPDLPETETCEEYVDHTLMLLLSEETEAALRWAAALVARDSSMPGALLVTSRLLEQMGRSKAAIAGLGLALRNAMDGASLPLALAAIEDLRTLFGVDVTEHLERLASTFCLGSQRLDAERSFKEGAGDVVLRPLSSFLSGPALGSEAAKIVQGAVAASEELPPAEPARIAPLPLFSALGRDALRDLLSAFAVMTVPAGYCVIEQGQPSDAVYVVARGELRLERRSGNDKPVMVTSLGEGAFFGEMALLSYLPAPASVVAVRPSILLVARRGALQAVVDRHPEVDAQLEAHGRRHLLANLGRLAPGLAALQPSERDMVVDRFQTRAFEKGERLIAYGEETQGLFVVASGEVAMIARDGNERVMLATLSAGEMFGEVELVLCRKAEIDAVAIRPTMTLFLPRPDFLDLVAQRPSLLQCLYMAAVQSSNEARRAMVAPTVLIDAEVLDYAIGAVPPAVQPQPAAMLPPTPAPLPVAPLPPAPAPVAPRYAARVDSFAADAPPVTASIGTPQPGFPEVPTTPRLPLPSPPPRAAAAASNVRVAAHTAPPSSVSPFATSLPQVRPASRGTSRSSRAAAQAIAVAAVAGVFIALGVGLPSRWYRGQPAGVPVVHAAAPTPVAIATQAAEVVGQQASEPAGLPASVDLKSAVAAIIMPPRASASATPAAVPAATKPKAVTPARLFVAAPVPTAIAHVPATAPSATEAQAPPAQSATPLAVNPAARVKPVREGQVSAQPASFPEDPDHFGGRD